MHWIPLLLNPLQKLQMNSTAPLISVLLPIYNGMRYLAQSVESVLQQELQHFELLIIDDVSTDGSYEYVRSLQDDRIRLFRNSSNKGLFYNLNFLVAESTTNLVKLWAQDDIMYPQCLRGFVEFHRLHPGIGFSYSGRTIIDEDGTIKAANTEDNTPAIISTALHAKIAYFTGSIAGNIANVCINKAALTKVGLFNEHMRISADFDMWVRLAEHYDTGFIKEDLIMLRNHRAQLSRNEKYYIHHVEEDLQVYRYLDGYVSSSLKEEGQKILRIQKLHFYCTLMLKAFLKGQFSVAKAFYNQISGYTRMMPLLIHFFKWKLFRIKNPHRLNLT